MIYGQNHLSHYKDDDWILRMLLKNETQLDLLFRTHIWLKEMENKRMIYGDMYGDFLRYPSKTRVLDIGGGVTSLTRVLAEHTDYCLLDFLAHGEHETMKKLEDETGKSFWMNGDWYHHQPEPVDVIVANDIFPDVDQRLELFIDKYLPYCKEMRLLVTYYNKPRFYTTKRMDDTEILTFLSWDGEITALKLRKYLNRSNLSEIELDDMVKDTNSIYYNGRQVCYFVIKGDLDETIKQEQEQIK